VSTLHRFVTLLGFAALTGACAYSFQRVAVAHLNAWEGCTRHAVSGNLITCDGHPFARLECLGWWPEEKQCRALTLTYEDGGRVIVFAAPGYDVNAARQVAFGSKPDPFNGAYYAEISPDAKYIWFKEGARIGKGQWRLYVVSDGSIRDMDPDVIWELRDLRY